MSHIGDGFLAMFDGPARAVTCAARITHELNELDIEIRAGLHTGEAELAGDQAGGLALHLANRIMAEADPGTVLVSATVKDLVLGSGIEFADRGSTPTQGRARHLEFVPSDERSLIPGGFAKTLHPQNWLPQNPRL